jgi:hypothetical protein
MNDSFAFMPHLLRARRTRQGFASPRKNHVAFTEPARPQTNFSTMKAKESKANSTNRELHCTWITSWGQITDTLILVKPETVVSWHRTGFRLFWRSRSR